LFASITALVGAVRKAYQGLVMDVKWSGGDGAAEGIRWEYALDGIFWRFIP
jgi:hypothetical protein